MWLASCSRSLGRLQGAVELRAGSLSQVVGLRRKSRGRDCLDRSRVIFFHRLFSSRVQGFSRDRWLGPSKCPEHVLGQQMVSFLVFVEKVPATGPHLSGILLYKRSLIKDF